MNIRSSSLLPGSVDPHVLQNQACQSASGFFQVAMCRSPRNQRNASFFTTITAMPLPPVKALRDRGVTVFAGNDDVRDTWSPFGNGDMLERAMLLAWRSGYRTDDDLAVAFDCASAAGAGILGLDGHGLEPGARADLFTVAADTLGEAVAQRPPRGIVVKSGRLVARDGKLVDDA